MRTTFRRVKRNVFMFSGFLVMASVTALTALDAVDQGAPGWALLFVAVTVGLIFVEVRVWFVRIVADPDGVLLVNWLRSRRLAWSDITSIDPPDPYGRLHNGILFTSRDSTVHVATAFSPGPLDSKSVTAGVVAELRELRARYGPQPPAL